MELLSFFKFLIKHVKVLILIPVIAIVIAYFLTRSIPNDYKSQAQISTGIVDKSDAIDLTDTPPLQQSEIDQKFSNLIQMLQMQRLVTCVSYKLIIHDLTSKTPFKKPSKALEALSAKERQDFAILAQTKYSRMENLSRSNQKEQRLDELINSMKYDVATIKEKLSVNRIGQSDYLNIEFISSNPELAEFTLNTLCTEFINYYTNIIKNTGEKSVNYLSNQLLKKQNDLNSKMSVLKSYKIRNRVLNLPEQARIIFQNMINIQDKQEEVQKDMVSVSGAIKAIERKFNTRDRRYFEATQSKINLNISDLKEKAKVLSDAYIENDLDPNIKRQMDSVTVLMNNRIVDGIDESIFNPFAVKQDLIAQKLALQTRLDLAENSVTSLNRYQGKLANQFTRLVPFEASIQSFERDIDIASREYLDILTMYNNTSLQTTFIAKLKLTQPGAPGYLLPSKKMLLIIMSGIITFVFCLLVLFVLFYLDDALLSAHLVADKTGLPVIGQLELLSNTNLNIRSLWMEQAKKSQYKLFKDQLRAIRLELNNELKDSKVLAITSLAPREGKTFLALNLAYAYAVTNKKVLVIDGNFVHSELTNSVKSDDLSYIEDYLATGNSNFSDPKAAINIMGNKTSDLSVLELGEEKTIAARFEQLKSVYDLIIIETPALISTEVTKEWLLFTDKVVAVFEHKEYITAAKKEQLIYLKSLESKFVGWIFNKVPAAVLPKKRKSWFKKEAA